MQRIRLRWQLFPSYVLLAICGLLAMAWYGFASLRTYYLNQMSNDLADKARLVRLQVSGPLARGDAAAVDAVCKACRAELSTRFTVVDFTGRVLGDSESPVAGMDNHAARPEIRAVLEGRPGVSSRQSPTLHQSMLYVAIPIYAANNLSGVIRASVRIHTIDVVIRQAGLHMLLGCMGFGLLAMALSFLMAIRISRPIEALTAGAGRFADGDLQFRLNPPRTQELARLADAMNRMAAQLDEKIRTLVKERNEHEAILLSMTEGVFAVDRDERLLSLNAAAARLMAVDPARVVGRTLQEVVRNSDLQKFVGQLLAEHPLKEGEIMLPQAGDRFLQAHGSLLRDAAGNGIGATVVLNDVTRLKRLEVVRRDFVANVSHELKTPITALKGFIETLQEGALTNPADARHFLEIMERQANRMDAIIRDLLMLSRLEHEAEQGEIALAPEPVLPILQRAVQTCREQAAQKHIEITVDCRAELDAAMNAPLLEQAVINLLDNAVKYSPPQSRIQVSGGEYDAEIRIVVSDQGPGIEQRHLPRLFERFYRVDTARSRESGGTGLGLAIVKHIALAHHGRIAVESKPGHGSRFTIHLPRRIA